MQNSSIDKEQPRIILHVIHGLRVGGAEVDLLRKCTYLMANYPYEMSVCCLMRRGDMAHKFEEMGVRVIGPLMNHRYDVLAGIKLRRLLLSHPWALIHTHLSAASLVTWLVRQTISPSRRMPMIAGEHAMAGRWNRWVLWLERQMTRSITQMTVPSHAAAQSFIQNGISARKLTVLDNCIDSAFFYEFDSEKAKQSLCDELGISHHLWLIGCVCRLEAIKDLPLLFEATAALDVHLIVAGSGSQQEFLEELISERGWQGKIHLLGSRDDIPKLLAAMDLFVLTSQSESFGLVVIEALLARTPVITTRVGGIPEITGDGAYAQLIPPGQLESLCQAIQWAMANPVQCKAMTAAGHDFIKRRYSVQSCSLQLHKLYSQGMESRVENHL